MTNTLWCVAGSFFLQSKLVKYGKYNLFIVLCRNEQVVKLKKMFFVNRKVIANLYGLASVCSSKNIETKRMISGS